MSRPMGVRGMPRGARKGCAESLDRGEACTEEQAASLRSRQTVDTTVRESDKNTREK